MGDEEIRRRSRHWGEEGQNGGRGGENRSQEKLQCECKEFIYIRGMEIKSLEVEVVWGVGEGERVWEGVGEGEKGRGRG